MPTPRCILSIDAQKTDIPGANLDIPERTSLHHRGNTRFTLVATLALFAIALVAIHLVGCDEYNVVEPRFFSSNDIVDVPECPQSDGLDNLLHGNNRRDYPWGKPCSVELPTNYSVRLCWWDKLGRELAVSYGLPCAGDATIRILDNGGDVVATLLNREMAAGAWAEPWVAEEEGTYAVSLSSGGFRSVTWFEVD